MTVPEVALTYLAVVWTLLFFALGAALFLLARKVQAGLDLINEILATTRDVATTVAEPIHAVADGLRQFAAKTRRGKVPQAKPGEAASASAPVRIRPKKIGKG